MLLYAEALSKWKHGLIADTYNVINATRRRGYDSPSNISTCDLAEGPDGEGFREAARKERSYELPFGGRQRMDLVRQGVYYNII